jgi:hypothetical protein
MNGALGRVGIYTGQGAGMERGTVLAADSPVLANLNKIVAGQNLSGDVVREFFGTMTQTQSPLLRDENDVARMLASPRMTAFGDNFYLIAISVLTYDDPKSIVAHEIQHATYHLDPDIRATVGAFWSSAVPDADKAAIRATLGRIYNSANEALMIDEFQAYILQPAAENAVLGAFVATYRAPLLAALLANNGYTPPTVE